jgi:hypothetical protein
MIISRVNAVIQGLIFIKKPESFRFSYIIEISSLKIKLPGKSFLFLNKGILLCP